MEIADNSSMQSVITRDMISFNTDWRIKEEAMDLSVNKSCLKDWKL